MTFCEEYEIMDKKVSLNFEEIMKLLNISPRNAYQEEILQGLYQERNQLEEEILLIIEKCEEEERKNP